MRRSPDRGLVVLLSLVLSAAVLVIPSGNTHAQSGTVTLEWLGWNAWRATSPTGQVLFLNPFLTNPDGVLRVEDVTQADLILVTNGHGDEVGQAVELAQNTGARIIPGSFELGSWFSQVGVPAAQALRVSPGDRVRSSGITVRVLNGVHGDSISPRPDDPTPPPAGGIVGSFMITFENGWTLYYGGSSAATQDMALWARMYQPHAAILKLSGNTEPMDFAASVSLLMTDNPNLSIVFPGHHRFVQQGTATTIAEAQAAMTAMGIPLAITEPAPGQSFEFTQ